MTGVFKNIVAVSGALVALLAISIFLGLSMGSSGAGFSTMAQAVREAFHSGSMMHDIIWKIRFP
ncbi:MAG: hypothetical protein K9K82_08750, partial [Desulfobacteraceae bacterium]|nr:hypothetical protein [Desulfobacteraceae bacterium]